MLWLICSSLRLLWLALLEIIPASEGAPSLALSLLASLPPSSGSEMSLTSALDAT